jgi:lysophospholipase L1-like esterase
MPVTFTVPTAIGGQPPVTVACSAQSGAPFPLGSTIVTCTATDTFSRQASCNFNVTVTAPPRISKTRFLAFGDSITFGRCGASPSLCPPYTVRLMELLTTRYTQQTFTVTNVGVSGEIASDDLAVPLGRLPGQDRLDSELSRHNPEVLLLMEGTNDLFEDQVVGPELAALALDRMVMIAQGRGVTTFLATIPPQRLGGSRDDVALIIPGFNDMIRNVAQARGATLVDIYGALNADLARYIGIDDLHPTEEGLRVIGETFYAAVRNALDTTPTTMSTALSSEPTSLVQSPWLSAPPSSQRSRRRQD